MRFEEYLAARRTRLVEHAVALGVEEDDAAGLVDATLARHRRQVERAEDPDPLMHEALARAAAADGPRRWRERPGPAGRTVVLVMALSVVLVVSLGGVLLRQLRPEPVTVAVPTLFGFGATTGSAMLRAAGFDVAISTVPVCEPRGQVLGSSPAGGTRAVKGSRVELRSAVSPDDECTALPERAAAWEFVSFVRGGPAPGFADRVEVVIAGRPPVTLAAGTAAVRYRWGGLLDTPAAVFAAPARSGTSTPQLVVRVATPPARRCGTARPPQGGGREALRLQVQPDPEHVLACPLTIDLFRSGDRIDTVVVYRPEYDAVSKWS